MTDFKLYRRHTPPGCARRRKRPTVAGNYRQSQGEKIAHPQSRARRDRARTSPKRDGWKERREGRTVPKRTVARTSRRDESFRRSQEKKRTNRGREVGGSQNDSDVNSPPAKRRRCFRRPRRRNGNILENSAPMRASRSEKGTVGTSVEAEEPAAEGSGRTRPRPTARIVRPRGPTNRKRTTGNGVEAKLRGFQSGRREARRSRCPEAGSS